MVIRFVAALLAGMLLSGAQDAAASHVTLLSAYRNVEASIEYTRGAIHKLETATPGNFDGYLYVDNSPSYVHADLWAHHVSNLQISDDALQLSAAFDTYVYWYWPANQLFSFQVQLDFVIDEPMRYEFGMTASCSNWLGGCYQYTPWSMLDGDYWTSWMDWVPTSGTLAPGEHTLLLQMTEYQPWYGYNSVDYGFSLQALPQPVPLPGSLPLVLVGLLAMGAARRPPARAAGCS